MQDLPIERYAHGRFLPRIRELPGNVTAYAAACLALAEILGVPVLTGDRRLARVIGHGAPVVTP